MEARGLIIGLTQGATEKHIVRAALESIAYQTKEVIEAMKKDSEIELISLNVDGGASSNNFLMQFQSDILNCEVIRPAIIETTALGAAFLAGIGVGLWKKENLIAKRNINKIYSPQILEEERALLFNRWKKAVNRSLKWNE